MTGLVVKRNVGLYGVGFLPQSEAQQTVTRAPISQRFVSDLLLSVLQLVEVMTYSYFGAHLVAPWRSPKILAGATCGPYHSQAFVQPSPAKNGLLQRAETGIVYEAARSWRCRKRRPIGDQ